MYSLATAQRLGTCYQRLPRQQRISFQRLLKLAFCTHLVSSRTSVELHDMPNMNPDIRDHANIVISELLMLTAATFHVLHSSTWIGLW